MKKKLYDANGGEVVTGYPNTKTRHRYKWAGTSLTERWYTQMHFASAPTLTTGAPAIDTLHAFPIGPFDVDKTIDGLGVSVTSAAAGSKARIIVFSNTADGTPYPNLNIGSSSELDTSATGAKTSTGLSISLSAGSQYWIAYWAGTLAPTVRSFSMAATDCSVLGFDNTFGANSAAVGVSTALTYTTSLPSAFGSPFAGTPITAVPIPAIFVRFSS